MAFSKTVIHLGPIGKGKWGKVFNNGLILMNQQNIAQILDLAVLLELPLGPLIQVLRSGSASSVALEVYGTIVNRDNVGHMRDMVVIDADIFQNALGPLGDLAAPVVASARAGAEVMPKVFGLMNS